MSRLVSMQMPFPRRLTKMYTDTKSSYDFVKEPVQSAEDPEILSLHRKLRIQKDRLVSWGLEWSDPTQSPDIDESISKAGLSELVGSVMGTIKEILAEAEPLWQVSKRGNEERPISEKSVDRKPSLIVWDKSRFEDLVKDLTMSIDTLYDLSRTRQSARKPKEDSPVPVSPPLEERQFESTRMQTPQQIDPARIMWPRDLKGIHSGTLEPAKSSRQIVYVKGTLFPLLLEHAPYDPIYSVTGISPPMTRFEKLFAALSQAWSSSERLFSSLLRLVGYFEEPERSRFCLLFELPNSFGPLDIESPRVPSIFCLSDLIGVHYSARNLEPTLEVKYRLAYNVANAVFDLHSKGMVHGNVTSSNVLFAEINPQSKSDLSLINMRQSFLTSFDLFSDTATDSSAPRQGPSAALHRHHLDPRATRYTRLSLESKSLDLYSLAMVLVEIGMWNSIANIFSDAVSTRDSGNWEYLLKRLAQKCGSLFVKAIEACRRAPEEELSQKTRPDVMLQKVSCKVAKALNACCAIDELDSSESEAEEVPSSPVPAPSPVKTKVSPVLEQNPFVSFRAATMPLPPRESKTPASPPPVPEKKAREKSGAKTATPIQQVPTSPPKLRTYPSIRISQEHLNFWHTSLMKNINHVLRGFYKKYPESVEISLESIGESPSTAKPTILVICTSVNKVRSILKKSLIYDKSIYGLKVCRGKVVRSRKHGARRSTMNEGSETEARNGGHQPRPSNGASIGAYVNDRHLPPVSFGGLILVDNKSYGMTVHHMLDDPDSGSDDEDSEAMEPILRSSGRDYDMPDLTHSDSSVYSSGDEEFMYTLSDYDSDFSSNAEDSDDEEEYEDDFDEGDTEVEAGDIRGIQPNSGTLLHVTQPALDDLPQNFYPSDESRDEEHLSSFCFGSIHASSGIRRRTENDIVHEIDWALISISSSRHPSRNLISNSAHFSAHNQSQYPVEIAPLSDLPDLPVHCMARTSGLQTGRILPGLVSVKIYGRTSPSASYQVAGRLGVPGDSGAWVVDNEKGRACGHVLAWSDKKKVAYICPMEILVRDIGETLGASVGLPGGEMIAPRDSRWSRTGNMSGPGTGVDVDEELQAMMKELSIPAAPEQMSQGVGEEEREKEFVSVRVARTQEPRDEFVKAARMGGWSGQRGGVVMNLEEVDSGIEVGGSHLE